MVTLHGAWFGLDPSYPTGGIQLGLNIAWTVDYIAIVIRWHRNWQWYASWNRRRPLSFTCDRGPQKRLVGRAVP